MKVTLDNYNNGKPACIVGLNANDEITVARIVETVHLSIPLGPGGVQYSADVSNLFSGTSGLKVSVIKVCVVRDTGNREVSVMFPLNNAAGEWAIIGMLFDTSFAAVTIGLNVATVTDNVLTVTLTGADFTGRTAVVELKGEPA